MQQLIKQANGRAEAQLCNVVQQAEQLEHGCADWRGSENDRAAGPAASYMHKIFPLGAEAQMDVFQKMMAEPQAQLKALS